MERVSMKVITTLCHLLAPLNQVRSFYVLGVSGISFVVLSLSDRSSALYLNSEPLPTNRKIQNTFAGSSVNFYMTVSEYHCGPDGKVLVVTILV